MKNKISLLFLAACIFMTMSCNWQIPKSVSVSTEAEFNVSLGTKSFDTTQYLSSETLIQKVKESLGNNAEIYDYVNAADEDTLTYLLHYPVYNVPFNPSEYLSSLDLDSLLGNSTLSDIDQNIQVPSISVSQTVDMAVGDIVDTLMTKQNIDIDIDDFPTLEAGTSDYLPVVLPPCTIKNPYAKGIKYKAGSKIIAKVEKKDATPLTAGYSVELKVTIPATLTGSYKYEGYDSGWIDVANGGTIEIPLDKGYIPDLLLINFEGRQKGGADPLEFKTHNYSVTCAAQDVSIIEIAEINLEGDPLDSSDDIVIPAIEIPSTTVPLAALPEMFINAVVGSGNIGIAAKAPIGWKNISLDVNTLTIQGAGLNIDENDLSDVAGDGYLINKSVDISNQKLSTKTTSDLTMQASLTFDCAGGTIVVTDDTTIKADVSAEIENFSEINLDLSSFCFALDDSGASIPEEVSNYVKKITFQEAGNPGKKKKNETEVEDGKGFGIECKVINSLPVGNDFPIKVSSNIFGLSGANVIQTSFNGTGDSTEQPVTLNSYADIVLQSGQIDFKVEFGTQKVIDGTSYDNCITLVNIAPGSDYRLKISDVKFLCDWNSVEVNLGDTQIANGEFDLSQFNISELLNNLPVPADDIKKLSLDSLKAYFYAQQPESSALKDLLGQLSLTGSLNIKYTDKTGTDKNENVLADNSSIGFVDKVIWPAASLTEVTQQNSPDFIACLSDEKSSFNYDFATVINDFPENLKLAYDFKLETDKADKDIKVYSYVISELQHTDNVDISIDMVCEIPFKFGLDGAISMDIMNMISGGSSEGGDDSPKDLLNRENASTLEQYAEYADLIDYFKVGYTIKNDLLKGLNGTVTVTDAASALNKSVSFEAGQDELKLSGEEIKKVFTTYPFAPSIIVNLGTEGENTELFVSRSGMKETDALAIKLNVGVKMDGDTPITVWRMPDGSDSNGNE